MKLLLTVLSWLAAVVLSQVNTSNFYTGTITVAGSQEISSQRIPRISDPVVLLTLNELSYNTIFSLSMQYNISSFGDYEMISLNVSVRGIGTTALIYQVTVQYAVLKELPFMETIRINITQIENSRTVTSVKKIAYDQGVALSAFCIGFSNVNLTTDIFYYASRNSTNYTIYSKSNFTDGGWVLIEVILLS